MRPINGRQIGNVGFKLFNNVNFNAPNSNLASAQFGRITSALDPRILQFGLKLLF